MDLPPREGVGATINMCAGEESLSSPGVYADDDDQAAVLDGDWTLSTRPSWVVCLSAPQRRMSVLCGVAWLSRKSPSQCPLPIMRMGRWLLLMTGLELACVIRVVLLRHLV